ncbi:SusC/RagA family TonB-linked outer membrane protein [Confluentibacter flavum]|uniref:TonB-dependent receptor n=1 Tax=Confluentibacter flavum TaxID=1909700 RepID=A0A2N3HL58_9FLAO|nr:TonB-dependent receptor [Confluentibacter flavum]PKQ45588.1 TonB-dependent receptor [Confluentibacter flavum]
MKKLNPNGIDYWSIPNFKLKINLFFLFFILLLQVQANTYVENDKISEPILNEEPPQFQVSGTVKDEFGEPLLGATILVAGTSTGTTTDFDGNYTISAPNDGQLIISYIGYTTQTVAINNRSKIDIVLASDATSLEETIVVGYGTQKKITLTGSVVDVQGEEIAKSPNANITASLQGRLPGLVAVQRSGEPGRDDANILIRGNGTTGNNSPLIIIDGVERSLIGRLNPDDIESISVLKDASAAIYGARGGNGVILVTTKKGDIGKPQFSISYNSAFSSPTQIPDMMDAVTYAQVYNEGAYYRAGRPATFTPFYSDEAIQKYRDGSDPILFPNTDWMGEIRKDFSLQQRVNMSVNGGSEAVRYLLSFGTTTQDGDFKYMPTEYKQFNFRAKIDVNINENLSIGANISGIFTKRNYSIVNNNTNFTNSLRASPLLVARYPNGLKAPGRFGESPLLLDQRGYNRTYDEPIYSSFTASYKVPFVKGLRVDASYNYDLSHVWNKTYNLPYTYHEYNVNTQEYDLKQGTGASTVELNERFTRYTTKLFNYRITYDNNFGDHHIAAMVGQETQQNTDNYISAYRRNFISPAIDQINAGSNVPDDKNNGGNAGASARNNYLGRLNYEFQDKYLFEFAFRYEGSQNFPQGKRYGFFPVVQVGWVLSQEKFFQDALPFVNTLKLRATHGQVGNDRINQYQYLQLFSLGGNYTFGTSDSPGLNTGTLPNPNVTWEVSTKTDFGLSTSLWNGLLGLDLTYFMEKREDILTSRNLSIPSILGFPNLPPENIGKVDNKGFEIIITHKNTIKDLKYDISANMGYVKSNVVFLDEVPNPNTPWKNVEGHPVGAGLYYQADGIFNTQAELDAYPHQNGQQVGDIKIIDYNGDGVINADDQFRFDKNTTPEIIFGMNMNFEYKNFDLNLFFQGQTNAYHYDGDFANFGNADFTNGFVGRAADRWTVSNPNGTMPRADSFAPGSNTFFLFDATFVRLKSMEIGWTIPEKLLASTGVNSLRFYASGFNLLTWAKEKKFSDPEGTSALAYPQLRTINLGVNVKF